jgi:hypothetical protein
MKAKKSVAISLKSKSIKKDKELPKKKGKSAIIKKWKHRTRGKTLNLT